MRMTTGRFTPPSATVRASAIPAEMFVPAVNVVVQGLGGYVGWKPGVVCCGRMK